MPQRRSLDVSSTSRPGKLQQPSHLPYSSQSHAKVPHSDLVLPPLHSHLANLTPPIPPPHSAGYGQPGNHHYPPTANMTDKSPETNSNSEASKKKSTKKAVSCESCRRRKLKCDRGWPCGACRDRGESSKCEWADGVRPQTNGRDGGDTSQVNERLDRLEAMMGAIATSLGVDLPGSKSSDAKKKGSTASANGTAVVAPARSASGSISSDHPCAPVSKLSTLAELGAVEAAALAEKGIKIPNTSGCGERYQYPLVPNSWGFGFGFTQMNQVSSEELTRKTLYELLVALPDTGTVRALIGYYFREIGWLSHLIPEEAFMQKLKSHEEMRLLWDGRPNSYKFEDLRDHLRFAAVLHALCGGTIVFGEPIEGDELQEKYGKNIHCLYLDASQHALSVLDIYEDLHIDNIRTMMILATCLNALKGPTVGSAMMANIYFMAYALQLDVEPPETMPSEERKDRICLFASLCISDWFAAGNVKRTYTIDPANTNIPSLFGPDAEKNDILPVPMRYKLKLSNIARRASHRSRMGDDEAYELTKQLHHEVVEIEAAVPPELRFDESLIEVDQNDSDTHVWHRSALALALQMQLLTLHKRFYVQSWTSPKYKESRDISFAASMLIIKIFRNSFRWFNPKENSTLDEQRALIGEGMRKQRNSVSRLWFFAQMSIISSLVLIHFVSMLDTHPQEACDWDSSELRAQITDDLKFVRLLLQALSSKSKLALDGARAIQPPEQTSSGSRKRKAESALVGPTAPGAGRGPLHSRSAESLPARNGSWYSASSAYSSGSTPAVAGTSASSSSHRTPPAYNSPGSSSTSSHSMPHSASTGDLIRPRLPFPQTGLEGAGPGGPLEPTNAKSFDDIEALWQKQPWQTASLRMGTSPPNTSNSPNNSFSSATGLTPNSYYTMSAKTPQGASQQRSQLGSSNGVSDPVLNQTANGANADCPYICASFFGPDASFKDIASAEAAIGRQEASYGYPVAPLSPFTAAFINSLDQYVTSLDEPLPTNNNHNAPAQVVSSVVGGSTTSGAAPGNSNGSASGNDSALPLPLSHIAIANAVNNNSSSAADGS